jgi:hypothetical protein
LLLPVHSGQANGWYSSRASRRGLGRVIGDADRSAMAALELPVSDIALHGDPTTIATSHSPTGHPRLGPD